MVGWFLKKRSEELQAVREKLREDRRRLYLELIEPYVLIFGNIRTGKTEAAVQLMQSEEYKRTFFHFALFGDQDVVRAFNALMQYVYQAEKQGDLQPTEMMGHYARLLLAIREDLGAESRKLHEADMLRGIITDIDKHLVSDD